MAKTKITILELRSQRMAAKAAVKRAEADVEAIDSQLLLMIKPGDEVEGVVHVTGEKGTPKWKSIFEEASKLIPLTKRGVLPDLIVKFTGEKGDFIRVKEIGGGN